MADILKGRSKPKCSKLATSICPSEWRIWKGTTDWHFGPPWSFALILSMMTMPPCGHGMMTQKCTSRNSCLVPYTLQPLLTSNSFNFLFHRSSFFSEHKNDNYQTVLRHALFLPLANTKDVLFFSSNLCRSLWVTRCHRCTYMSYQSLLNPCHTVWFVMILLDC